MTLGSLDIAALAVSLDAEDSARLQEAAADLLLDQATEVIEAASSGLIGPALSALPEVARAKEALTALGELPLDRRQAVVLHATFRYWQQALRRTSGDNHADAFTEFVARLADLTWAELAETSPWEGAWSLRADAAGGVRCPSRRRFLEFGPEYADSPVTAEVEADHVVLRCVDGLTVRVPFEDLREEPLDSIPSIEQHGYALTIAPTIADGRIEIFSRDSWLRLRFTGTNQRTDGTEFFGSDDDLYPADFNAGGVEGALRLLERHWSQAREDIPRYTHTVVGILAPPDAHQAFTVSSRQGAVYICAAPAGDSVEMLLHECAHIKLRQVQLLDTLLADPLDDTVRVAVPWRPDPRPIPGVFEGLYVFAHVAEYRQRRARVDPSEESGVAELLADVRVAERAIRAHGQLTPVGEEFLAAMTTWLDRLEAT